MGEEGGLNLYVYVRNNVVNEKDSEGMLKVKYCSSGLLSHSFLLIDYGNLGIEAWGLYPKPNGERYRGEWQEGVVKDDKNKVNSSYCKDVGPPENCRQERFSACVISTIEKHRDNPPKYHIMFFNCKTWAYSIIMKCWLNLPFYMNLN